MMNYTMKLLGWRAKKIVHIEVWEESMGDVLDEDDEAVPSKNAFDIDIYLESGVYFELYSTLAFVTVDSEPIEGLETIQTRLATLAQQGVWLEEIAVDEENSLILVLGQQHQPQLYLLIGAWTIGEWDELPEE